MQIAAPRPLRRLLFGFSIILIFSILSLLLEPRRRSLSCPTIWSCLSPYSTHTRPNYQLTTVPEEQQIFVAESNLADGTVKFNRKLKETVPETLFLVLTGDGTAWSRDYQSTRRSVYDFLDLLASTRLEMQNVSLGLLTRSKPEYDLLKRATDEIPLGRVTILLRKEGEDVAKVEVERPESDRYRAALAKQKNYLMQRVLLDEKHVIWIDPGVVTFSPAIVQRMIAHGDARKDVGIITARCEKGEEDNYDTRAWAISETSQLLASEAEARPEDPKSLIEELDKSRKMVPELIKSTSDSDLIPLHSVGGTLLYIKADLVRQGLVFPWWKAVGSSWRADGWVGSDTEGLCHLSSHLGGGGCFVLGGTNKIRHADVI